MSKNIRIVGAGAFVPDRRVTNERIVKAIPGWPAEKISEKTGIEERRFLWDFDETTGRAIVPPDDGSVYPRTNTDMCEVALLKALTNAGLGGSDLDGIMVVTCSPDELNFSHDATLLHHRMGCRPDALAIVVDSGCGGALYMVDVARKLIEGGSHKTIAVVASNMTSAYVDREVFTSGLPTSSGKVLNACLTMYLFGDGAGAVILQSNQGHAVRPGFVASMSGVEFSELVLRRGGGAMFPPHTGRATPAHHSYIVDGPLVAKCFPPLMRRCLDDVLAASGKDKGDIDRFYLHQANKRLVEMFAKATDLPEDKVALHMDRYGNTSAAGTLILFAEDIESGVVRIGGGQTVLFAAIGAGVHYGAHVVRL